MHSCTRMSENDLTKKKLPDQLCHLETMSKIEAHHLAEASLSNQHIVCNQNQDLLQSHSINRTSRVVTISMKMIQIVKQ